MLYGMGIVFVFLLALVTVVAVMSRIVQRYFPNSENQALPAVSTPEMVADPHVVAVIQAALDQHRQCK